jgi:hypothetical protein
MQERLGRNPLRSITHASQALDQIAMALEFDSARRTRYKNIAVRLVDAAECRVAEASVGLSDAIAKTKGEISASALVSRVNFDFTGWDSVRAELKSL